MLLLAQFYLVSSLGRESRSAVMERIFASIDQLANASSNKFRTT